jgi:tRNA(Ile)-lysidine synthase
MPAAAVAASGGRDSTALLHASVRAARDWGIDVHALHVHHGLVAEADDWWRHVERQCRRWGAHFHGWRLQGAPARGDSIEAWARRERYRALARMAQAAGCSIVLLAHHRQDQAETLLLQALRGGGPAGLAAMPRVAERAGIVWARPWLDLPRSAIEAYVRRHRLRHVDDASNADARYARNRLRGAVWPALLQAFPDAEPQLAAAAARAAEAAAALEELATADLETVTDGAALDVARWLRLSGPRRALVLRRWRAGAPESLVQRLLAELPASRAASWPAPGGALRLHRGQLVFDASTVVQVGASAVFDLSRPGLHRADGWGGAFDVRPVAAGGIAAERLRHARLAARAGGEQFQAAPRGVPRSLKKQYQAAGLAAWQRGGPLVFDGETLVFAPGLGADARCIAPAGAAQLEIVWRPD